MGSQWFNGSQEECVSNHEAAPNIRPPGKCHGRRGVKRSLTVLQIKTLNMELTKTYQLENKNQPPKAAQFSWTKKG